MEIKLKVFIGIKNNRDGIIESKVYTKGDLWRLEKADSVIWKGRKFCFYYLLQCDRECHWFIRWIGWGVVKKWKPPLEGVGDVSERWKEVYRSQKKRVFLNISLAEEWHIFSERNEPAADNRAMLRIFLKLYIFKRSKEGKASKIYHWTFHNEKTEDNDWVGKS